MGKQYKPAPTRIFLVQLSHWTSPTEVRANSKYEAKKKALKRFPLCDCGCDEATSVKSNVDVTERLEQIRGELRAERISYGELAELQGLSKYIEDGDVELLEPAGVPEGERN